jgi:hypothetical protein
MAFATFFAGAFEVFPGLAESRATGVSDAFFVAFTALLVFVLVTRIAITVAPMAGCRKRARAGLQNRVAAQRWLQAMPPLTPITWPVT